MYPNSTETEAPALGTLPDLALGTSSSICHLCPLLCNSHTGMHLSEFCELLEHVIETGEGLWGPQLVAKSNRSMGKLGTFYCNLGTQYFQLASQVEVRTVLSD